MFEEIVRFSFPTTIVFGRHAVRTLPQCLDETVIRKPLIVTDPGLKKTGIQGQVEQVMKDAGREFATFDGVHANPVEDDVVQATAVYKSEGCDGIVGLGGGSPLDVAKAVAVLAAHGGPLENFEAQTGGYERITGPLAPVITIPTTAGTGSEVGRSAVITLSSLGRKVVIFSPLLMPKRAILDPDLTVGLPPGLTAATGMDALTHHIESLTSPVFHPLCDAIAIHGIELVVKYLERATKDGTDIEARGYMLIAASMGAIAFQKDLGATHSLAHPLSTEFNVHHGLANAICLPAVMRFNKEVAAKQYARVAQIFGVNTFEISKTEAAEKAVECVVNLIDRLGIPKRLRECKVPGHSLVMLKKKAFADSCHATNPRPCTEDDLWGLYQESW